MNYGDLFKSNLRGHYEQIQCDQKVPVIQYLNIHFNPPRILRNNRLHHEFI